MSKRVGRQAQRKSATPKGMGQAGGKTKVSLQSSIPLLSKRKPEFSPEDLRSLRHLRTRVRTRKVTTKLLLVGEGRSRLSLVTLSD